MGNSQLNSMRRLFPLILFSLLLASCIPNKKVTFLQKGDDVTAKGLPLDTVMRSYDMQPFDYKLQTNDVLNIRFGSLTDDKFDFLNKMQQDNGSIGGGGGAQGAGYVINGFLIDQEGNIEFPVVGKVPVSGLSIFEGRKNCKPSPINIWSRLRFGCAASSIFDLPYWEKLSRREPR